MSLEQDRKVTSKLVDEIILFTAISSALAAGVFAPNIFIALDKPLRKLYKHLDDNERKRQLQKTIRYMRQRGMLAGSYEHGLQLTDKARKRLARIELEKIEVAIAENWDGLWRIVMYDIPESQRADRIAFTSHLRQKGFFLLQQSAWINPFPCRELVEALTTHYTVDKYVTYFEAIHLDNAPAMVKRFQKKYPQTHFKHPPQSHHAKPKSFE